MWPLTLTFCRCRTDSPSFSVHQPFEQIGYPFEQPRLSVQKNCHPFERLGLPLRTVRTACQLRYCSKTISPEQFATNLSENVHNSSKRCLPSPHVLSRYIFYSIHLFFFYNSRLSLQLLFKTEFLELVMFWPFCMQISNDFGSLVSPVGIHSHWQW